MPQQAPITIADSVLQTEEDELNQLVLENQDIDLGINPNVRSEEDIALDTELQALIEANEPVDIQQEYNPYQVIQKEFKGDTLQAPVSPLFSELPNVPVDPSVLSPDPFTAVTKEPTSPSAFIQYKEEVKRQHALESINLTRDLGVYSFDRTFGDFIGGDTLLRARLGDLDNSLEQVLYLRNEYPDYDYTVTPTLSGDQVFFKEKDKETWYPVQNFREYDSGDIASFIGSIGPEEAAIAVAEMTPLGRGPGLVNWGIRLAKQSGAGSLSEQLSQYFQEIQGVQIDTEEDQERQWKNAAIQGTMEESFATFVDRFSQLRKSGTPLIGKIGTFKNRRDDMLEASEAAARLDIDAEQFFTPGQKFSSAKQREAQLSAFSEGLRTKKKEQIQTLFNNIEEIQELSSSLPTLNLSQKVALHDTVTQGIKLRTLAEFDKDSVLDDLEFTEMTKNFLDKTGDPTRGGSFEKTLKTISGKRPSTFEVGTKAKAAFNKYVTDNQTYFRNAYRANYKALRQDRPTFDLSDTIEKINTNPSTQILEVDGVKLKPSFGKDFLTDLDTVRSLSTKIQDTVDPITGEVTTSGLDVMNRISDIMSKHAYSTDPAITDSRQSFARGIVKSITDARANPLGVPVEKLDAWRELNHEYSSFIKNRKADYALGLVKDKDYSALGRRLLEGEDTEYLLLLRDTIDPKAFNEIREGFYLNLLNNPNEITQKLRKLESSDSLGLLVNSNDVQNLKSVGAAFDIFNKGKFKELLTKDVTDAEFAIKLASEASVEELNTIIKSVRRPEAIKKMLRWGMLEKATKDSIDLTENSLKLDTKKFSKTMRGFEESGLTKLIFPDKVAQQIKDWTTISNMLKVEGDVGASLQAASLAADFSLHTLFTNPTRALSSGLEISTMNLEAQLLMSPVFRNFILGRGQPTQYTPSTRAMAFGSAIAIKEMLSDRDTKEEFRQLMRESADRRNIEK